MLGIFNFRRTASLFFVLVLVSILSPTVTRSIEAIETGDNSGALVCVNELEGMETNYILIGRSFDDWDYPCQQFSRSLDLYGGVTGETESNYYYKILNRCTDSEIESDIAPTVNFLCHSGRRITIPDVESTDSDNQNTLYIVEDGDGKVATTNQVSSGTTQPCIINLSHNIWMETFQGKGKFAVTKACALSDGYSEYFD